MIGTTISHYYILEKLGQGGMGSVYKALDQKLHRLVAIKFLNPEYLSQPDYLSRFEQEAISASSLNHPNICTIHEIDSQDGKFFIVMEFVDGKTLTDVLAGQAMSEKAFLEQAIKICAALAVAHSHGIIHRDIKPDNVMLTADGAVKLMDFGLAKLKGSVAPDQGGAAGGSALPARSRKSTMASIWGSIAYISPEQIDNKPVDERSDIFSLGVMLYEMYTGILPFTGDDAVEILKNILETEPKPASVVKGIQNTRIDAILQRALAKEPGHRYQSIVNLAEELGAVQHYRARKKKVLWPALLFLLLAIVLVVSLSAPESREPLHLKLNPVILSTEVSENWPSFSPDGAEIIYTVRDAQSSRLVAKKLTTGRTKDILHNTTIFSPHLSPAADRIVFSNFISQIIIDTTGHEIKRIPCRGILPRWSPDGRSIAFCRTTHLDIAAENSIFIYDTQTEAVKELANSQNISFAMPDWSPDNRWMVFVGGFGSVWELWLYDLRLRQARPLSNFNSWITNPRWSRNGDYIYFISNEGGLHDLWRVRVDLHKGRLLKAPEQLTNGLQIGSMDISPTGESLIFSQEESESDLYRLTTSKHLNGEPLAQAQSLMHGLGKIENLDLSPEGSRLVVEAVNRGVRSMLIKSFATGEVRLLYNSQPAYAPAWSADGERIFFDAGGGVYADIYEIPAGGGIPVKIIDHAGADWFPSQAPNGQYLCWLSNRNGQMDLWLQARTSDIPSQLTCTKERESRAAWSHNSRYVAFFQFIDHMDSASICMVDVLNRQMLKLANVYDPAKNITTKLCWDQHDTKLYFFLEGSADTRSSFAEIGIRDKHIQPLFWNDHSRFWTSAFAIDQDHGYFIVYQADEDIWLMEGLK